MKAFDPNYKLLDEMYQDDYYPASLVDKVKDELQKVIDLLESGETDIEVVQLSLIHILKTLIWQRNLIRCLTSSCWMSYPRGMTQKADAPFPYPVWRLPEMAPAENTICWKMAPSAITAAKGRQAAWPRAWTTSFPCL